MVLILLQKKCDQIPVSNQHIMEFQLNDHPEEIPDIPVNVKNIVRVCAPEHTCTWQNQCCKHGNSTAFLPFQIAFLDLMPFRINLSCASFIYWQYLVIRTQLTKVMNYYVKACPLSTILKRKIMNCEYYVLDGSKTGHKVNLQIVYLTHILQLELL